MITVVILTLNEEENLRELLPTLSWADRVMVIDDQSTDDTVKVAQKYKASIFVRALNNNFAAQRNFALKKVKTQWTLFLDADERVSESLAEEIMHLTKGGGDFDAYRIRRVDVFEGRKLLFGETRFINLTRLGKTRSGVWDRPVHETWHIDAVGTIKTPLLHLSHRNYEDLRESVDRYSDIEAGYRFSTDEKWTLSDQIILPVFKFVWNFIFRLGFLDGIQGLKIALGMSLHSWWVRKKLFFKHFPARKLPLLDLILHTLVWLTFGIFSLGQLSRFELPLGGAIYGFELLMLMSFILWLTRAILVNRKVLLPVIFRLLMLLWIALFFSLTISLAERSRYEIFSPLAYWLRLGIYGSFGWMLWNLVKEKLWRVSVRYVLVGIGIFWAISGLLQWWFVPDVRFLYYFGFDDHYYRVVGLLLDPGFLGLTYVLTLILLELLPKNRLTWMFYAIVLIALGLTYARSAYMVYLVSMMMLAWNFRSIRYLLKRSLFMGLIILMLTIWLPAGGEGVNLARTYSIESRATSVLTAYDIFKSNPRWGIGFNRYPEFITQPSIIQAYHPSSPDNSFMLLLTTTGLIGMLSIVFIGWKLFREFSKDVFVWVSASAVMVHSLTNNSLFYVFVLFWMMGLLAEVKVIDKEEYFDSEAD